MTQKQTDNDRIAEKLSPPSLPFDLLHVAPVRLRPADLARLMGVSRARVSQLVAQGRITAFPDGSIDPNTAAAELIAHDPKGARSKILTTIRSELDDATRQAAAAIAERNKFATHAATVTADSARLAALVNSLRDELRKVARLWLEGEAWLSDFERRIDAAAGRGELLTPDMVEAAFNEAGKAAMGASLDSLSRNADPEALESIIQIDPECGFIAEVKKSTD